MLFTRVVTKTMGSREENVLRAIVPLTNEGFMMELKPGEKLIFR